MNNLLKTICLTTYFLAAIGAFWPLPTEASSLLKIIAAILLLAHSLELALAFKSVRRYPGSLIDSIGLTLLFGMLHWLPLARKSDKLQ